MEPVGFKYFSLSSVEDLLEDGYRLWSAHPHDADPPLAQRGRDGGDGII
jgi:hypothetical protein